MEQIAYPRFEYWKTGTQWYWHLQAANYKVVGSSGGFNSEAGVLDAIRTFCQLVSMAAARPAVHVNAPQ